MTICTSNRLPMSEGDYEVPGRGLAGRSCWTRESRCASCLSTLLSSADMRSSNRMVETASSVLFRLALKFAVVLLRAIFSWIEALGTTSSASLSMSVVPNCCPKEFLDNSCMRLVPNCVSIFCESAKIVPLRSCSCLSSRVAFNSAAST